MFAPLPYIDLSLNSKRRQIWSKMRIASNSTKHMDEKRNMRYEKSIWGHPVGIKKQFIDNTLLYKHYYYYYLLVVPIDLTQSSIRPFQITLTETFKRTTSWRARSTNYWAGAGPYLHHQGATDNNRSENVGTDGENDIQWVRIIFINAVVALTTIFACVQCLHLIVKNHLSTN